MSEHIELSPEWLESLSPDELTRAYNRYTKALHHVMTTDDANEDFEGLTKDEMQEALHLACLMLSIEMQFRAQ